MSLWSFQRSNRQSEDDRPRQPHVGRHPRSSCVEESRRLPDVHAPFGTIEGVQAIRLPDAVSIESTSTSRTPLIFPTGLAVLVGEATKMFERHGLGYCCAP